MMQRILKNKSNSIWPTGSEDYGSELEKKEKRNHPTGVLGQLGYTAVLLPQGFNKKILVNMGGLDYPLTVLQSSPVEKQTFCPLCGMNLDNHRPVVEGKKQEITYCPTESKYFLWLHDKVKTNFLTFKGGNGIWIPLDEIPLCEEFGYVNHNTAGWKVYLKDIKHQEKGLEIIPDHGSCLSSIIGTFKLAISETSTKVAKSNQNDCAVCGGENYYETTNGVIIPFCSNHQNQAAYLMWCAYIAGYIDENIIMKSIAGEHPHDCFLIKQVASGEPDKIFILPKHL